MLFDLNNADHSIEMGLLLGRKLLGYDVDHLAVNTEDEYHEIKRGDSLQHDHFTDATAAAEIRSRRNPATPRKVPVD